MREPIATGAFGSVYGARRVPEGPAAKPPKATDRGLPKTADQELPKTAALKFLPTGTHTPRQLAHLRDLAERELELLSRLRTAPRLVRMYEALTVDDPGRPELDGATVLVLERAETSLTTLLAGNHRPKHGPVLLAQICEGLVQLHRAGWVHGDLKPANVLLMKDGSALLADFNMAAELEGTHAYTPAFSTPDYTPPELLWAEIGERGRQIRPSADVWAFGVLAHLVLTDQFPLPGGTPSARRDAAARYARGTEELRLSPELPDEWREIVRDCLARTHQERISGETLLRRVETVAGTARSPRLPRLFPLRRGRRTGVILSAAAATAATTALATLGYGMLADDGSDDGKNSGTAKVAPAAYGAAELRTDKGVPVAYRPLIVDSAHDCVQEEVTPSLIAAMLKVESDFDPDLSDPAMDEYGIARWTPRVLRWWMRSDGKPEKTIPQPPFSPSESIPAMSRYLCWIAPRLDSALGGDRRQVLIAAAYRTSYEKVNDAAGVPPKHRDYADRVAHYLKEYTPAGKK
ncbi:protein kinase [Streptomyces sporangiiformans]|uniref:Protein kinase n=1 Tax=Streptomyces sporangiiformans TaxID=2315329 RepID=A0A505DFS9_9ACTN|nr:protein kinase [Streptomyces sporangiiformans]